MGAKLLDVNGDRASQSLRPQDIEPHRRTVCMCPRRQAVFFARLVAGNQRLGILDRRRRPGENCDARLVPARSSSHNLTRLEK